MFCINTVEVVVLNMLMLGREYYFMIAEKVVCMLIDLMKKH